MNDETTHPSLAPYVGVELRGQVVGVNAKLNYGYVELADGSGCRFILRTNDYPGLRDGQRVVFTLDDGCAVASMSRDRALDGGLAR